MIKKDGNNHHSHPLTSQTPTIQICFPPPTTQFPIHRKSNHSFPPNSTILLLFYFVDQNCLTFCLINIPEWATFVILSDSYQKLLPFFFWLFCFCFNLHNRAERRCFHRLMLIANYRITVYVSLSLLFSLDLFCFGWLYTIVHCWLIPCTLCVLQRQTNKR